MTKLSTAAKVAHDLGLAACFGGTLFGKVVFNPSIGVIESAPQRGKVGGTAWNRFNVINAASFVAAAATWLPGRLGLSGTNTDRRTRGLVLAKDVLMGVASSTGLAALIVQILLNRQAPQNAVPLKTGGAPAPEVGPRATLLQRAIGALASANVAVFAALVSVRRSSRRKRVSPHPEASFLAFCLRELRKGGRGCGTRRRATCRPSSPRWNFYRRR